MNNILKHTADEIFQKDSKSRKLDIWWNVIQVFPTCKKFLVGAAVEEERKIDLVKTFRDSTGKIVLVPKKGAE